MRVLAVTDRSSLVLALTMMVPDWDVDCVASTVADGVDDASAYGAVVIEAPTTAAGAATLAGLRRRGCAAPIVIVGDVETDHAEIAVDDDGHVVLTRPFTIAEIRDRITAMARPMHETDRTPEAPPKAERRFPWGRTDGGTAVSPPPQPVRTPAGDRPDQGTYPLSYDPVVSIGDLSESAPAEATFAREASGSGSLDPDVEAPAHDPVATPPPRDAAPDSVLDVDEKSAADDELEDEHAWSRMLLAELVNAFGPVTAVVWVRRDGGAWTSAAALGLKPAESQRSVPPDHPLFADVAQDLHGLLLSPADLARGCLAGIPGTWTDDIMAVGIGSRRGCDAIVVVGGDAYEKRDVRRLVALAAGATPSRTPRRRRIPELFQRH